MDKPILTGTGSRYLDYWGKAQPWETSPLRSHPNAYHCLDVAAVGAALLDARPQIQRALARAAGLDEDHARRWFLFALALHDIGKFACCFQAKAPEHFRHRDRWPPSGPSADPGHGRTGLKLWRDDDGFAALFGATQDAQDARFAFDVWMAAVAGHHGRPIPADWNALSTDWICGEAQDDLRAYVQDCSALFHPQCRTCEAPPKERAMMRSSWLAGGLAMLCDWIGSNQEWFPYRAPDPSLADYWAALRAKEAGEKALRLAGLESAPIRAGFTIRDALPDIAAGKVNPTPLQRWAADVPVTGQSLAIIEDLTGAGKTEAGLILAHRLMASGAAEGLYWALPTMATADALYHRLAKCYQRMFGEGSQTSLMLAHSASSFNEVFTKSIFEPRAEATLSYSPNEDEETASAACARWLADDRRKTFLADIGVGTIDQALLGILPSKHQALRLAALSRRVLVVDEAHSFDAYMTKLLETLITFQAALGGSVIVMSATLTKKAREKFVNAFARGAGGKARIAAEAFPLATLVTPDEGAVETALAAGRGTRRNLPVRRLDDAAAAIATLKHAAEQGLGAVWIRNTVQDAMDAYEALRDALPHAEVDLFHARFALCDRLYIEKRVLSSFGKGSEGKSRRRIVIATQVVEQSLDCDWDMMISDLAPVDLLIQRAGRLHRHRRAEPRPEPVLHIVSPDPADDAGAAWYSATFPRAAYVYPHHGQLWLTMRALLEAEGLNLASASPRDLIERVFKDGAEEIPEALAEISAKEAEAADMSKRAIANMNALDLTKGYTHQAGAWESDTRTPTRLGDPSRVLRLAKWDGGRLTPWCEHADTRRAWRLSEVSVSTRRIADVDYSHDAALQKAVAAEIEAWPERFDPPLLIALASDGERRTACGKDATDKLVKLNYDSSSGLRFDSS